MSFLNEIEKDLIEKYPEPYFFENIASAYPLIANKAPQDVRDIYQQIQFQDKVTIVNRRISKYSKDKKDKRIKQYLENPCRVEDILEVFFGLKPSSQGFVLIYSLLSNNLELLVAFSFMFIDHQESKKD